MSSSGDWLASGDSGCDDFAAFAREESRLSHRGMSTPAQMAMIAR